MKHYNAARRDHVNARERKLYFERLPKVSETELRLYRADANRETRLGLAGLITCRECGAQIRRLTPLHLWTFHKMRAKEYQHKRRDESGKYPPILCLEERRKIGDKMRGKPGRLNVDTPVVERLKILLRGLPLKESAELANMTPEGLASWARRQGFPYRRRHPFNDAQHLVAEITERPAWIKELADDPGADTINKLALRVVQRAKNSKPPAKPGRPQGMDPKRKKEAEKLVALKAGYISEHPPNAASGHIWKAMAPREGQYSAIKRLQKLEQDHLRGCSTKIPT